MLQRIFNRKSGDQIVKEIHNEFDAAQDRLLVEAKRIINSHSISNKAERLKNLGFTSSEVVIENEAKKGILVKNKEQADLIEYYKFNYPFQKFLTEDELDRICNKYNLIYAPISAYKKDVPEKNITEIEQAAPLNEQDRVHDYNTIRVDSWWEGVPSEIKQIVNKGIRWESNSIGYSADFRLLELVRQNGYSGPYSGYLYKDAKITTIKRQGLFIAAPKSHFDLKNLKQDKKFGFFAFAEREVKDPIVFRYCKGGIQVLSKWGIEASDEGLVNEVLN